MTTFRPRYFGMLAILAGHLGTPAAAMIVAGLLVLVATGSSHNDAPLIAEDPFANNTDVYAFVSPADPNNVTLIANYIPNEEPANGPIYYNFSDNVFYEIHVDVDGDAQEDLTYQFVFNTIPGALTPNTFLYNVAPIGPPDNPSDPSSQYANLNIQQSYRLTEVAGDRKTRRKSVLLDKARVAPANIGPQSTSSYNLLADLAVHPVQFNESVPDGKAFAGPRDEGFYVDLMAAFDLLGGFTDPQRPPVDSFSGFNVHSMALEIPKTRFEAAGDTDGVIGVWATASRPKVTILDRGRPPLGKGPPVQVSRLGMPLTNELLLPLSLKNLFNSSEPKDDQANGFVDVVVNPGATQGNAALVPLLNILTGCFGSSLDNNRIDLAHIFLQGIPPGLLGLPGNQNTESGTPVQADMLRLNYRVPPSTSPNPLGAFGGDPAGFPNGRRVGDDVVDIALKGAAGGVLHLLGVIDCPVSLSLTDGVQANDTAYLDTFPYLGTPHQGYDHQHSHGVSQSGQVSEVSNSLIP